MFKHMGAKTTAYIITRAAHLQAAVGALVADPHERGLDAERLMLWL